MKWFISHNESTSGPFSTERVKELSKRGTIESDFFIWSHAQPQWIKIKEWEQRLPEIFNEYEASISKHLQHWHYSYKGKSYGPLPKQKLIEEIKEVEYKQRVSLWTEGMKSWRNIFEFNDILSAVGLNRRAHPRGDIEGKAIVKVDGMAHSANLKTISPGGCGLTHITNLSVGQRMHIEIKSKHFSNPLKAIAEVRYISKRGFVGIKFEQIHMESQSAIIDYIKKINPTIPMAA